MLKEANVETTPKPRIYRIILSNFNLSQTTPPSLRTLKSQINVLVGINILVGKFVKTNKRTGWNKRTVGKIDPKYCLIIPILFVNFLLSLEV